MEGGSKFKMYLHDAVRLLTEHDIYGITTLYQFLNPEDPPIDINNESLKLWQEILANPSVSMLGYEYDDEVVSCCTLCVIPNMSRGMKPFSLIENVVTHPNYRKRGFATTLLKTAQSIAWELGCYKVMLLTGSQQESTLLFYKKCGFSVDKKKGFVVYR